MFFSFLLKTGALGSLHFRLSTCGGDQPQARQAGQRVGFNHMSYRSDNAAALPKVSFTPK
jgi:hypothetical protein